SYILKNNKQYTGEYPSKVTDITLKIVGENDEIAERLESGYYDAAYISGEEYHKLKNSNITALSYANKTVAMLLNKNNLLFTEKKLRQAICLGISDIDLSDIEYLERATSLTPPSCTIAGISADKAIGNVNPKQNKEKAIRLWKEGLESVGASSADFTVIATEQYADIAKELVQGIQASVGKVTSYGEDSSISFSLKINILSEDEYNTALSKGEYDMAIYELEASSSLALNFLDDVINSGYAFGVHDAEKALESAQRASADKLADAAIKCERALISDYSIKPLFFKSSYYAQAENVSGVQFHPGSGRVCFVNADRKD
ncbi:MAG: ABC transporter substrate-binding protein, partial [Eubacterium sp.]